ncbi:MAG: hypothetical protein AAF393_01965 [Pseudomonadota bacterium]
MSANFRRVPPEIDRLDLVAERRSERLWFYPPPTEAGQIMTRLIELAMKGRA